MAEFKIHSSWHSKSNLKRLFFSFLAVFSFAFISSFYFQRLNSPTKPSQALENNSTTHGLTFKVPTFISLRIDAPANNSAQAGNFVSTSATAYVATNSLSGYNLSLSSSDANTDLAHTNSSITTKLTTISTNTNKSAFNPNTWGFSLDDNLYQPIKPHTNPTNIKSTTTKQTQEESQIVHFGAKLGDSLLSGTYQKLVTFTAIANPEPQTPQTTFNGITTMQQMTQQICDNETTPYAFENNNPNNPILAETTTTHSTSKNLIPEAKLIDTRDNKTYTIRKLADGNCWMVQNLDLGDTQVELTPQNTDLNGVSGFTLPAAQTSPSSWGNSNNASGVNRLRLYNDGNKWLTNVALSQQETVTTSQPSDSELKLRHIGNYYNWYAATAKTGTYEMNSDGQEASSSICPKGWRLPPNTGTKSYTNLTQSVYRLTIDTSIGEGPNSSLRLRQKPLSFPFSGYYSYSGSVYNQGSSSYFWSSTAGSSILAYHLSLYYAYLLPANYDYKALGFSIRCQAR